jgi:hypothetical protein
MLSDNSSPVKPIRALRNFLDQDEELKPFSTQLGLARLIDRSESLIRAVEGRRSVQMSAKLARRISAMTGVSKKWLMADEAEGNEVPAVDGSPLRHEAVIARINEQIDRNVRIAGHGHGHDLEAKMSGRSLANRPTTVMNRQNRQMAALAAKLMEKVLFESLERGESRLMDEMMKLLDRDFSTGEEGTVASGDED